MTSCISDARVDGNTFQYLVAQKDSMPSQIFAGREMLARWPELLFNFLEERIHIHGAHVSNMKPIEVLNPIGDPIRVTCIYIFIFFICIHIEFRIHIVFISCIYHFF